MGLGEGWGHGVQVEGDKMWVLCLEKSKSTHMHERVFMESKLRHVDRHVTPADSSSKGIACPMDTIPSASS